MNNYTKWGLKTKIFGKNSEIKVKEKLSSCGFTDIVYEDRKDHSYDMLLNSKYRIEVKSGTPRKLKNGGFSWSIMTPLNDSYDILAVVLKNPKKKKPIILFFNKLESKSICRNQYGITFKNKNKFGNSILIKDKYKYINRIL